MKIQNQPEIPDFETARQAHEKAKVQLGDVIQRMGAASSRRLHLANQLKKLDVAGKIDRIDQSSLIDVVEQEIAQLDTSLADLRAMHAELTQRVKNTEMAQYNAELSELLTAHTDRHRAEMAAKHKFAEAGLALIEASQEYLTAMIQREAAWKRINHLAQVTRSAVPVPTRWPMAMPEFHDEWVNTSHAAGKRALQRVLASVRLP